ncbi:peptigoglycan-binding protein LysM [Pseudomonas sp. LS44]|uniref:FimV/HubP family polar landmark protein n=1 Tax=Pseudomonas sp. LS44 TaxID=1357074 RepID=UPI00215B4B69|nr:FimV/HubP family polar landmark protein [Pseudomonas sp. LS44]UVE19696.1 peptigoglycan-binding protein LysM [Pseudomonas sp. LS44]
MVRVRKLVLAIAAASALTSGTAHALGLGEVTLKSALNQPLVAEIDLLEVRDLASNEVIPVLASPEEFTKAGVDRQYFLTDLKFTPVLKPNGKSVIRVTSSKPVREPYLNFLVQVMWPNGRLLREYTLLLDPPLYSPQTAIAAAPQLPVAAPVPRPSVAPTPAPRPVTSAPVVRQSTSAVMPTSAAKLDGDQYKTTSSDTLWDIAERSRASGSVHQAMLAIQDLNPDAFIGGNINRLRNGQVLRLPDDQQIKSRSQSEAIAQVAAQNTAWREGRSVVSAGARQLDATKRTQAGAAPAKTDAKDSLKLVSGDAKTAANDKGAGGDSKALNDKLAVTKESLDSTRRENDELKGRMTDLQSQLDKLQRLIQLKDDQMAKLQADLVAKGATAKDAAAPAVVAAPNTAAVPAPNPADTAPPVPAADTTVPDYNYSDDSAKSQAAAPDMVQPELAPVTPAAEAPIQPAAPVVSEAPAEQSAEQPQAPGFIDNLLLNPMLLGVLGGTGLLALLVGLMVLSRRNAVKENELQMSLADTDRSFDEDPNLSGTEFEGLESLEAVDTPSERVTAQTGDVLGEADIYIAYGRFNQAAELLQNAINDEPQRSDLRLKLMEVNAELGDREGFARQEQELREIGGVNAELNQFRAKYPAMAASAAAGVASAAGAVALSHDEVDSFSLDELSLDEEPSAPVQDNAFDLSLDDLDAELDRDIQNAATEDSLGDFDIDEELSFSSAPASADALEFDLNLEGEPAPSVETSDDFIDFNLDLDEQSGKPAAEEDFLLGLEDELPAAMVRDDLSDLSLELPADDFTSLELPADFDLSMDDDIPTAPAGDSFAAQLEAVSTDLDHSSLKEESSSEEFAELQTSSSSDLGSDDDFDFLSGTDETATKLDLARAYIDMGDTEGARDILDEVVSEGNGGQQQEARELIARLA